MNTLVTFLGKGQDDKRTGYRKATYRFPDGSEQETPLFGLALAKHLNVETLVILGTSGSQWGVLVEQIAKKGEEEDKILQLMEAEVATDVEQTMLDDLTEVMTSAVGCTVLPRLIPFGKDEDEQYYILDIVAESVPNGRVSFDVTHGFRHLGMVGFQSAFMLERVRNLQIDHLWYGALDMTDGGITPVLKLDGLTRVRQWVDALDRFDATGDYGVFAPLLIDDGVPPDKARCLERAAFHERTLNLLDAKRQLGTFLPELDKPLAGASGLFQNRLSERLSWVRQTGLAQYQRKLAFEYLKRRDFIRATIFGWEACVTLECEQRKLPADDFQSGRKPAIEALEDEIKQGHHPDWKGPAFWMLKNLRNALAHGHPPDRRDDRAILNNADRLPGELEKTFQRLLNAGHTT